MSTLLDYAWARPPLSALTDGGYAGAARYLSYDQTGKNLSSAEAHALSLAGLHVVSNWEWFADLRADPKWRTWGPYALGRKHAADANELHAKVGGPADAPIYVSADFDVPDYAVNSDDPRAKLGAVGEYFRGWCDTLGVSRVGGYGGYHTIKRLFDGSLITYGWQTRAWSGGLWDGRAHLRQTRAATVGGAPVDVNEIIHPRYGGWSTTQYQPPAPAGGGGGTVSTFDAWKDVVVGTPKPADMGGPDGGIRLGDWVGWITSKVAATLAAAEGAQAAANAAAATGAQVQAAIAAAAHSAAATGQFPGALTLTTADGHRLVLTLDPPA